MTYAPIARIILRYLVGALLGYAGFETLGPVLAADPDIVAGLAILIGVVVERVYALAKRNGWAT
ncbi:hypothetical protein ACX9MO_15255 [Pseudooceanicola sp. 502str34]